MDSHCILLTTVFVGYESTSRDEDWKLEIKSLRPDDAGLYECQVNTEPKIGLLYRLIVTGKQYFIAEKGKLVFNPFVSPHN